MIEIKKYKNAKQEHKAGSNSGLKSWKVKWPQKSLFFHMSQKHHIQKAQKVLLI